MTDPTPHDIVIVVPVADRPRHLSDCLSSLLELMRRYPYRGSVSVLVADDSLHADSLAAHRDICAAMTARGLATHYLSQEEQRTLVEAIPPDLPNRLERVIGDGRSYAHKGASITRNIAYLWLKRLQADGRKRLFWFIDSDQEFRVNLDAESGERLDYAIDYCDALDRIFNETPAKILTGKVVGDPPVSPAVMAGNFLDDVAAFLIEMAQHKPEAPCTFHGAVRHADDAAYHDMAELFGFRQEEAFRYHCTLEGPHDHARCFADFAAKLGRFFDGEHPTRRSVYVPADLMTTVKPARTVYTGNYVFTPAGLDYFIPFAALKLRMAGPTLGRIVKAELGEQFVSANLPMLHKRTVDAVGQSEFRPGVERAAEHVDLSGEFERQYFGDVMLFSMERIAADYPASTINIANVFGTVASIDKEMLARYTANHRIVNEKIARLQALYADTRQWWRRAPELADARQRVEQFIVNMQHNFGDDSRAWQLINDADHRRSRLHAIFLAPYSYFVDRDLWHAVMNN
jgi:hypothetical protein